MSKSKYDKVFTRLKPMPVEDMDYQAMVDVVKQSILESRTDVTDDVAHEMITDALQSISDEVKVICQLITNIGNGRQHATVFGRYWLELRRIEDHVSQELKNVRLLMEAYQQLGIKQFEVEATDIITFEEDLGRIQRRPEITVKTFDKDVYRNWCMKENLFRELNMHPGTIAGLTKLRLLDGHDEPPGVRAFFTQKFTK